MDYLTLKIISIVLILAIGLLGGLFPIKTENFTSKQRFFSRGAAFSGGVFIGAGLIHMLPDANEGFADSLKSVDYPIAFLVCAMGFLLILMIDKIFFGSHGHHSQERDGAGNHHIPYILAVILSVHSIIAGIALGVDGSVATSLIILIAILSHKGSAAFALGVSLMKSDVAKEESQKAIYLFSVMTPLGVLIGVIMHHFLLSDNQVLLEATFDAIAAGTFLYIAIIEVIKEEFDSKGDLWIKFCSLTGGLAVMGMLAVWL